MNLKSSVIKKTSLIVFMVAVVSLGFQTEGFAEKSSESIQSEIDAINVQLQYLKIKVKDNKNKSQNIERKIKEKKLEIENLGSQIEQLAKNRVDILAQIDKLELENQESRKQLKELLSRFRNRLVQLHKIRQGTLVSSVLFAKDMNSFLNRYQMVKYLLESDKNIIEELKEKDAKVRTISEKLIQKNKALDSGKEEIVKKQKELAKEQASLKAMLNTVLMEKKVYLAKEKKLASSLKELEGQVAEVAKKVAEPDFGKELTDSDVPATGAKASNIQTLSAEGSAPKIVTESISENAPSGAKLMNFLWPIEKALREMVTEKGEENSCAILIKPIADAEVIATARGKVLYKGFLSGLGDVVILGHQRGFSSVYARLDNVWVGLNEVVEQGAVIGKIDGGGNNGILHFEIRFGGKKVPPLEYLPQ